MMAQIKKSFVAFLITFGLLSNLQACMTVKQDPLITTKKLPEPPQPKTVNSFTPFDRVKAQRLTDTAKLLAGLKVDNNSPFANIQKTTTWINHHRFLNNSWSQLEKQQLSKVKKWTDSELKTINAQFHKVFYPFSGPDALYVYSLFPKAQEYILVGLEPIGTVPDFSQSQLQNPQKLLEVRNSLYALLKLSFFRTNDMKEDFANQGVLPIIFLFLARTNNRILDAKFVGIDGNGNLQKLEKNKGMISGIKITFVPQGESTLRILYYFSTDLSDAGLAKKPQLSQFIKKMNISVTYLKAASYLMYYDNFSTIKNLILSQSSHLLQDDSGIPLKSFNTKQWHLKFYGTYTKPIALFSDRYQPDLKKIYQTDKTIKPLNFGIGYQFNVNDSNLMLVTRK